MADDGEKYFKRNSDYLKPGPHVYNTALSPEQEQGFQHWVAQNKVPFDIKAPVSDYDMRGFYQALLAGNHIAKNAVDPNDWKLHYPDFWKTPYHETFSNESQWASPTAPRWNDKDQLVATDGTVIFDDRAQKAAKVSEKAAKNTATVKAARASGK